MESLRSCIFLVMCDKYTDVFNKEQFSFCMQWVNNKLGILEKFLGFYKSPDMKSSTIVTIMNSISQRYQLNRDMCRGLFYDGASNIVRKLSCVTNQTFAEQPKTLYTHCHIHSPSLSATISRKILKFCERPWVPLRK